MPVLYDCKIGRTVHATDSDPLDQKRNHESAKLGVQKTNCVNNDVERLYHEEDVNVNVYRSPPIANESPWPEPRSFTSG